MAKSLLSIAMYPLLFGWWLLLAQFSANADELTPAVLPIPLLTISVITLMLWTLGWAITRSWSVAGLMSAYLVITLTIFGYIQEGLGKISPALYSGKVVLLGVVIGLGILFLLHWRKLLPAARLTPALNVVAVGLVAMNLGLILQQSVQSGFTGQTKNGLPEPAKLKVSASSPDIYVIVPDRYPNNDTLKRDFNFDNSDMYNQLAERGFTVNPSAYANYQYTTQSLASTLNGTYLDSLAKQYAGKTTSLLPLQELIRDNWAIASLKSAGYYYANLGSWWGPTRGNPHADYSVISSAKTYKVLGQTIALDEYMSLVAGRSVLQIGLSRATRTDVVNVTPEAHAAAFQAQLKAMRELAEQPQRKYVFVHMLMPHPPFVYAADGKRVDYTGQPYNPTWYVEQIKYTNRQLLSAVDYINKHSKQKPIIVIQADEGPYPGEGIGQDPAKLNWAELPDEQKLMKLGAFQAVQYPAVSGAPSPEPQAHVNQFRYMFNRYFGTKLEILPEKHYYFPGQDHPYDYRDITALIEAAVSGTQSTPAGAIELPAAPTPAPTPAPEG